MNLQHLGCWNHLEKLAEMLLNTFHREHILLILKIKKLLRKVKSKNLTTGVCLFLFFFVFFVSLLVIQISSRCPFLTMGSKQQQVYTGIQLKSVSHVNKYTLSYLF